MEHFRTQVTNTVPQSEGKTRAQRERVFFSLSAIKRAASQAPRRLPRRHRRGIGAELIGYGLYMLLAVIAIAAAFVAYQAIRTSQKESELRVMLTRAQTIIEQGHSYSGIYANQSLLSFLSDQGFTDRQLQRISAGNYIFTSPYDTAITITGNGARDFTISIADIPKGGCKAALLAFQDSGAGLDSATVGSTAISLPMAEAAVDTACDGSSNTVNLTF